MDYGEFLKRYVIRKNPAPQRNRKKLGKNEVISRDEYVELLREFCKPEDLVGVSPSCGCFVFNLYLSEHGKPQTGRNIFSRMVKETFGMRTKVLQTDNLKRSANVFVMADDG